LLKIAEKALSTHKKVGKAAKTEVKLNLLRSLEMSWNLFERIINAFKPSEKPEQVPEEPQSWPESGTEQPEASQEPSPSFQEQETANTTQQNEWQD